MKHPPAGATGGQPGYALLAPPPAPRPALRGAQRHDIAIIGGGLAGLNTALSLVERGADDIVLLEAARLGAGASGRNGGFVFAGYSPGEAALLRAVGPARARRLYARSRDGVERTRERIHAHGIRCRAVEEGVLWANWFRDPAVLERRRELLARQFGVDWTLLAPDELRALLATDRYTGALLDPEGFHLDPLALVRGLGRVLEGAGVRVHEGSAVLALERDSAAWRLRTAAGSVRCRQVVLACGAYGPQIWAPTRRAALPIATCVMLSEPLGSRGQAAIATGAAVHDSRFAFDYYRLLPDSRLLWGGRIAARAPVRDAVARQLRRDLARVYPQLADVTVAAAWSGLMSYARHQMPQVGGRGDGLWWTQGFGGHGLAPTAAAGEALAAAVLGDPAALDDFAPFGLTRVWGNVGLAAAQLRYSALQLADVARVARGA